MKTKSIGLACILKNEVRNLPRMLASVEGCFDEIHLTDTGSTDGSIEFIEEYQKTHPEVFLHHFEWVDDFAAARNYSFSFLKTDHVMWMDLDDVLSSKKDFISWKNDVIHLADYWLATYQYALHADGRSACSFARERVWRNGIGLHWKYFIHEGVMPQTANRPVGVAYAQTWCVKHLRSPEDLAADKSRNMNIFARHEKLDARMTYYYGKELFEQQRPLEAFEKLLRAVADPELQAHDRIMGIQYAGAAAMQCKQFEKAISMAHQGLQLAPQRAEFLVLIADSYLALNRITDAIPYYQAAANCPFHGDAPTQGPTFSQEELYKHYPLNQLAKIYFNLGDMEKSEEFVSRALLLGPHPDSIGIKKDIETVLEKTKPLPKEDRVAVDEIVISCPPQGLYEWDWNTYQTRGIGGSETAAVEVARWMSLLTGRRVIVFNPRKDESTRVYDGVEYRPASQAPSYFQRFIPSAHIAWRHCTQFADVPTYVWCHDLATQGMEQGKFHRIFALSEFHKRFLKSMHGVPEEKIVVTSNGIDPLRFLTLGTIAKNETKVVYSSSPDRGLENALKIMDEVVKAVPTATLHVYYGFDNMRKMGAGAEADRLEKLMYERPYVRFHGNIPQAKLTEEIRDAAIWLYPTNFLETYCITAIEMLCSSVYPVVREWGALPDTLGPAVKAGMARLLDVDPGTPEGVAAFADAVKSAIVDKAYQKVNVSPLDYSWENVAKQWIEIFGLGELDARVSVQR